MFSLINLRRILSAFLVTVTLFLGSVVINQPNAIADSITRDVTNAEMEEEISDAEYQSAKAARQQEQAMRSQRAEAMAEQEDKDTISEKLNLDEILPDRVEKAGERITGK